MNARYTLFIFSLLIVSELNVDAFKLGKGGKINDDKKISEPREKSIFQINRGVPNLIHGDVLTRMNETEEPDPGPVLWPDAKIPFEYSSNLSARARVAAELARREYKLRTCIEFVPRTNNETDYVVFMSLDGCYSYVGVVGGPQVLSLGTGCGQMATAIHEMMHASGNWHEQSRADRDSYLEILWENIIPDQMHNFDSYDFLESNPQEIPYNYESVMHYDAYAFSLNGEQTIQTFDPKFTTTIGQRMTFSYGDAAKLNRQYGCSAPLLDSYSCSFEQETGCGYIYTISENTFSWIPQDLTSDDVDSDFPQTDATYGKEEQGRYMVANVHGGVNTRLTLSSSRLTSKSGVQCLQFSYYITSQAESPLTVKIGRTSAESSDIEEQTATCIHMKDSSKKWVIMRQTITVPSYYRLLFTTSDNLASSDIVAIDDVSVQDKPCDTGFFTMQGFSSYDQNESCFSPVMYTVDGYAFQLLIYPAGTSTYPDHVGVYFALTVGQNDAFLQWPFCDRIIKVSMLDQTFDRLHAMDYYITSRPTCSNSSRIYLWERPDLPSEDTVFWGYGQFFPISDLTRSFKYLKHDSLVFSALVTDMTVTFDDQTSFSCQEVVTTAGQTANTPKLLLILFIAIINFWLHHA